MRSLCLKAGFQDLDFLVGCRTYWIRSNKVLMSNTVIWRIAMLLVLVPWVGAGVVGAAVPPKEIDQLREAELIVVGVIDKVMVESERSRIERGFGNYDWGIYLTLTVETVEKGDFSQPRIEAWCFRVKSRRSATEYLSVAGHDPIPGVGTKVRVYLKRNGTSWDVVIPNGITPHDADTNEAVRPDGSLGQASELASLSGLMYTYLLPLELWGLVFFVFLPIAFCVFLVARYWRRRQGSDKDESESSV
ncbi:MAG: hypothetical protein CMM01_09460 [Rhodopirellula sp.]|nr:hypothetical protein [Rhodopirellula sp.]OUX51495.1 MAG: hypothetical protein CBE43_03225 [Rhodopirellula sp. TMED283]